MMTSTESTVCPWYGTLVKPETISMEISFQRPGDLAVGCRDPAWELGELTRCTSSNNSSSNNTSIVRIQLVRQQEHNSKKYNSTNTSTNTNNKVK
ncbi:hypothetical protein AWRI1499_4522 [Brettanomyces bruxellensis AWRI1499]|nr:hypothetical protein AWRI1499_4522 [Brettanomyces bruxellensis AWRI1499]